MRKRSRTLSTIAAALVVGLSASFTAAGAAHATRLPAEIDWSFDEGRGDSAKDSASGRRDTINYVFTDARYKPDSDPIWRDGIRRKSLYFDGYSTWIDRPASAAVDPSHGLTVEFWAAPYAYELGIDGKPQGIVNQHDRAAANGYLIGLKRFGQLTFQAGFGGDWRELDIDTSHPLAKNTWSHVLATWDPDASQMRVYLNGQRVGALDTPAGPLTPAAVPLRLGKHNNPSILGGAFDANLYNGLLDEVRVTDKPTSDSQASRRYQADLRQLPGGKPPAPNLQPDRTRYDGDQHRPQYHMSPPAHWMNEPNAPLYFDGKYHIFYQHNPQGPYWGQIHWGHAVSTDLVHWTDQPMAMAPGAETAGPDGIWSGTGAVDGDRPVLFFTGVDDRLPYRQRTALATSSYPSDHNADLPTWTMNPTPVTEPTAGLVAGPGVARPTDFRDPFVWKEDGVWYQAVASVIVDPADPGHKYGGTALLYTADKPEGPWIYRGPLYHTDSAAYPNTGDGWELPVFLPLPNADGTPSGKHVLMQSPFWDGFNPAQARHVVYWIGTFDKAAYRFVPDDPKPREFDFGQHLSGPVGFTAPDGRAILWTITQDDRTEQQHYQAGWAHNAGLPLNLTLGANGALNIAPVAETRKLRSKNLLAITDVGIAKAAAKLDRISGDMLEIDALIEPRGAAKISLGVRVSSDGTEKTLLEYDVATGSFTIDRTNSSLDPDVHKGTHGGQAALTNGVLHLRVFLDRSMVEAFAGDETALTSRVYPTKASATGLRLTADQGFAHVRSLNVWRMGGAYEERVVPAYFPPAKPRPAVGALPNHDFATGDLTGWTVLSGDAFTDAHVTTHTDWGWGGTFRQAVTTDDPQGHHLWGFHPEHGGDGATGAMKSATVTLGGDGKIDLLVGGGNDPDRLYIAAVKASDGTVLAKDTGRFGEAYRRVSWDLRSHVGQEIYILVVDQATGGWGHINVDDVNVPVRIE